MKVQLTALIAIGILIITNAQAADLPEDLQRLVDVRETEIRKIDQAFVRALEKLKEQYTKKGDLETAVLIKQMIDNIEPSVPEPKLPKNRRELQEYLLNTRWTQNDNPKQYGFYEDDVFGDRDGVHRYKVTGKDTVTINWNGGPGGIRCKFSMDYRRLHELHGARAVFKLVE